MKNKIQTASEVKNSSSTSTLAHETRKDKQGLIMFVMAVASHGGAMEADTIRKNGRSMIRQRSKAKIITFLCVILSIALGSCNFSKVPAIEKLELVECITGFYHEPITACRPGVLTRWKNISQKPLSEAVEIINV